jgi:hypothetical protein
MVSFNAINLLIQENYDAERTEHDLWGKTSQSFVEVVSPFGARKKTPSDPKLQNGCKTTGSTVMKMTIEKHIEFS